MISTIQNLLKLFTLARPPEAATVQQMSGGDAYLDGLLGHRAHEARSVAPVR